MQACSCRDLGLLIKDRRRRLSLSQAELAERIGASRHWVISLEAGRPGVELGLVLRALTALGLVCNVLPREQLIGAHRSDPPPGVSGDAGSTGDSPPPADLLRVLSRTRASGRRAANDAAESHGGADTAPDED